jgi:hypothetical protein
MGWMELAIEEKGGGGPSRDLKFPHSLSSRKKTFPTTAEARKGTAPNRAGGFASLFARPLAVLGNSEQFFPQDVERLHFQWEMKSYDETPGTMTTRRVSVQRGVSKGVEDGRRPPLLHDGITPSCNYFPSSMFIFNFNVVVWKTHFYECLRHNFQISFIKIWINHVYQKIKVVLT